MRIRILAALLVAAVVGVVGFVVLRSESLPEGVALQVGKTAVTTAQFEDRIDTLRALYGVQPPKDGKQLDQFRRDSAKAIALSIVLDEVTRDRGVVIGDKAARDVLTRFVDSQFAGGGRSAFVQALGAVGASEQNVLDEVKRQLSVSRLFDEITRDVTATDADVTAAFAKRKGTLGQPEQRRISNIVVADRAHADKVLQEFRSGADFGSIAARRSLDGSTRGDGGDIGVVSAADVEPGYAKVAFAAAKGTLFGPVQTRFGWNVGRVEEIVPAQPAVLADVHDQLRTQLTTERALEKWRTWLAEQLRDAQVRYAAAYRPADPDSPPPMDPRADAEE